MTPAAGPGAEAPSALSLDFEGAARRIAPLVRTTPVLPGPPAGPGTGPSFLKAESLQRTGSFKIRGAANRLLLLSPGERASGVVACSSGNHGRAVAAVARELGIAATICVPRWTDPSKLRAIEEAGARLVRGGESYDEAEDEAIELAERSGAALVHPFDDPHVVAGQGTIGLELLAQVGVPEVVVVPLSGGGLISGVAASIKRSFPRVRIVGASAEAADVMLRSLPAGAVAEVEERETLAEALSGGIGRPNRYTMRWVNELVDQHLAVQEEEIAEAMRYAARALGLVVEGGGAVALAALRSGRLPPAGRDGTTGPTVVLLTGSNVEPSRLARVLA